MLILILNYTRFLFGYFAIIRVFLDYLIDSVDIYQGYDQQSTGGRIKTGLLGNSPMKYQLGVQE